METRSEISGAADAQAAFVDGADMLLRHIVRMDFHVQQPREMRAEDATDGSASDDANLDAHELFRASRPV